MAIGIRSWTTTAAVLGVVWATAVSRSSSTRGLAQAAAPFSLRRQHEHPQPTSLLLSFTTPTNGSRVEGPDVKLHYKIFSVRGGGNNGGSDDADRIELTKAEVRGLADTTTVCFKLHGFDNTPETCAPLRVSAVTIRDALPAKWHTVTGWIKDTQTGQLLGGSNGGVSVFNNLNGYGVLDMCGESACLDSSDLRAAYFDYVYR